MPDREPRERCPTCGSSDPDACGLPSEIGCDHPALLAAIAKGFEEMLSGELTRKNRENFDLWMKAHGYA